MWSVGVKISFQQPLALFERDAAQIVAIQIEQVEQEQRDGSGSRQMRDAVGIGHRDARLDEAEAGAAVFIQHRDLAIQNGVRCLQIVRQYGQLRILLIAALACAREDAQLIVFDENDGADAVPFHFVEPLVAGGRVRGEGG